MGSAYSLAPSGISRGELVTDLRKEAAKYDCQLRADEHCNTSPTCLAHYRVSGVSGMGMKSPDVCASISCFSCHELVDKRRGKLSQAEIDAAFARGMARTLKIWVDKGILEW